MRAYLLSRLGQTALVVFLSLTAVFFLVRLAGDPVLLFLPMDIQAKDINEFRQRLGFNDPLTVQYAASSGAPRAGISANRCATGGTRSASCSSACPPPSRSAGAALLLTLCLAIPAGVLSAVRRGSLWDYVGMGAAPCWARPSRASGSGSC